MGPGLEGPEGGNPSMDLGNPGNGDNDHRVIGAEDPPMGVRRGMDVRQEGSPQPQLARRKFPNEKYF